MNNKIRKFVFAIIFGGMFTFQISAMNPATVKAIIELDNKLKINHNALLEKSSEIMSVDGPNDTLVTPRAADNQAIFQMANELLDLCTDALENLHNQNVTKFDQNALLLQAQQFAWLSDMYFNTLKEACKHTLEVLKKQKPTRGFTKKDINLNKKGAIKNYKLCTHWQKFSSLYVEKTGLLLAKFALLNPPLD
jgi:hypothetical protein